MEEKQSPIYLNISSLLFLWFFKKNPEPIHRIWEQPVSYNRLARKWLECQELQIRRKFMQLDHLA